MKLQNWFFLFFLFILSLSSFGQYFPTKNYTTADGLPNNAVRSLFLDSKNVLWIGTENGVSIMQNGAFSTIDESNGLGHNSCWDISQDTNGNMWFASYGGGVSKFDGQKFTVFTKKVGLLANKTRKVFPYKNKMYVGTEQGVSIIDINSNKVITPIVPVHKEDFICISFFEYGGIVYFASVFDGLYKIDESGSFPKIIPVVSHKNTYGLGLFGSTLYSGNNGYINIYDILEIKKGKLDSSQFGKSTVWQFAKDKRNIVFAAAWGIYNPDGGLYRIENDEMINISDLYGIDSKVLLNVVYNKKEDILYVGSNDKGIYEVRLDKMIDYSPFYGYSVINFENNGKQKIVLHSKGVSILNTDKEILKTVSLLDFKKAEQAYLNKGNNIINKQGVESRDFELNFNIKADGIVFYEMVKHKTSFWIGSNIGIFEMNSEGKIINYIPKHSLKFGFSSNDKFIETITYAGVRVYDDIYSLKSTHYSKFEKNTPKYIVQILNNKNKTYLLSVFNGLYVYHNNQFQSYLADGIWKENKFKHITVNEKDQLILAAEFGNVFIVDDRAAFKVLDTIKKEDLIGKTILFLEAYKDYIFIGTEKGINIYQNGIFRFINKEQGLNDCNFTVSQIRDNELWLGTKNGFYTVDLDIFLKEQIAVSGIDITKITVNNIPVSRSNYKWFRYSSKKIVCDYQQNSFLIDFVPNGNPFPEKLKFRYRLKSTNRWSPYSDKTNLFLPYLPYGKYEVQIEVFDLNNGLARVFNVLSIQIRPPFWLAWWFISLIIIIVFGIVVYIIIRRNNSEKEKAEKEKQITEAKHEALSNQMNPHFIFNALNSIQEYVGSNDEHNSSLYISEFAGLMRKTLKNSPKQTITIEDEIEYLSSYIYIENRRFKDRVAIEIFIDPSIDMKVLEIPPMLIQPFVENVFVHAFDECHLSPKLKISFEMVADNILECKISDNGKGLNTHKQSKFHVSRGIALARERIILLQPSNMDPIHLNFTENEGTTITIRLII
ncbi:sensor histidine kinase [Flavobacterium frigoris]|uniref:Two component regulator propeller n=1 Tax=Flavobacterium frigoris TaxID=229204 RepID=A0A1H9RDE1_FLAFI|nr:histidine kinase [Flavobacterium frigoris]SER69953.1 Two component regulator propeller [Flavobacterium frigoris]